MSLGWLYLAVVSTEEVIGSGTGAPFSTKVCSVITDFDNLQLSNRRSFPIETSTME